MSLFPALQPIVSETASDRALPMATDVAWDFEHDRPIFRGGEPQRVTGKEAVKVWAFNALKTVRRRWPALSPNYGNDSENLIGTPYSEDLKRAEASRYIQECLTASPYINSVRVTEVDFADATITMSAVAATIYGEVDVNV